MKPPTPQHQARQSLKAALNGRNYVYDDVYAAPYQGVHADGQVILSKEAARLIDQLLTRAHYEGELEKGK